ncbi:lytic transglycosylase domain-containing protein [bacterium LRH843]|nr:lytic transglycosylase domain-containing protein [bacterium LRH843]
MKKIFFFGITLLLSFLIIFTYIFTQNDQARQIAYKTIIGKHHIPKNYVPVYKEAALKYDIPWELLASVHRVETIFSTMDPLVSPAGAVGHFQFMPRTWVGWSYPGGSLGEIDEQTDITDVSLIAEHNGYGTDAKGKGKADPFDLYDATFAAARYLADHGAAAGEIERALFAYNQSDAYVEEVMGYYNAYLDHYELIKFPF